MRYFALACDYDGTLAYAGRVSEETLATLERLLASGRKLILVTGRELPDLLSVFPRTELFEWIVAENGALLYRPANQEKKRLAEPPPPQFITKLRQRNVEPLSVGQAIVATWHPHETTVLEVIRELGLELQVVFNKGAVMVLPPGTNKASGLTAALKEMCLSPHNVVGIGDAENDHAFLSLCECSVAVANALPMVKETADFVTQGDHGTGVIELIEEIIENDLRDREDLLRRHHLLLGLCDGIEEVRIKPFGMNLLLAGSSGGGKSTLATGLIERLGEQGFQFCIIDPEGDYESLEGPMVLGNHKRPPTIEEVVKLLQKPSADGVIKLVGLGMDERPAFFIALLTRLQELRAQTGRPHWILVDEAHHVLPASWEPATLTLPQELDRMIYITVDPHSLAPAALASINTVIALGDSPENTFANFCQALEVASPEIADVELQKGEVLVWFREKDSKPFNMKVVPGQSERRRHQRKYAEGDLGDDRSFYFEGPEKKLKLKAQNLMLFIQLAEGVDDETWNYHLQRGDFSHWFGNVIKDEILAAEASRIEGLKEISPAESRRLIKAAITERYTAPT
jgi:HAD superfamily hydrolase (TIGR01484 family)